MGSIAEPCEACGTANRANANFCSGCAAKLPGFAATGPSALEILYGRTAQPRGLRESAGSGTSAPPSAADVLRPLLGGGVLVMLLFLSWYLWVKRDPTVSVPASPAVESVVVRTPAFDQIASLEPDLSALPAVSPAAQAAAARTTSRLAPALPLESTPVAAPMQGARSAVDTVALFYRALEAGDGRTAAEWVVASKRDEGPLSGGAMSAFYRSLTEPLRIRSIRQLDEQSVEARYTYRATRTLCEGRALLTMESTAPAARIRTISANC